MKSLSTADIRKAFLDFFKSRGHEIVPSSGLVPENDPTILFTNAGMNQFKDCFLGAEKRSYVRAATCQKCMRISGKHNDLENVGVTARHHTFFEMLGNFSFGDYFKAEAIKFAWEFSTETLGLDKNRLWVTIYEEDDEAAKLWATLTDVKKDRILRYGKESNFWQMGDTGPCGPCTEIFYYLGDDVKNQSEAEFRKDDGTYIEFWNNVFMQFNRTADGTLHPLPKPAVDTGMGLERVAGIVQGKRSNYDADNLRNIIAYIEQISGFAYDGTSYEPRDLSRDRSYARDVAMRVITDHARSSAFLIAGGVHPGADGRGYVLRRLIRRAVRHGRALEFKEPFMAKVAAKISEVYGSVYPELRERADLVCKVLDAEERKFHETMEAGLAILEREEKKLKPGVPFPGAVAFTLHDTYGFPLDLTEDALKAHKRSVDVAGFNHAMEEQKKRSREERRGQGIEFSSIKVEAGKTEFLGYEALSAEARLTQLVFADAAAKKVKKGGAVSLIFDATPFYAESGGQVGDTGRIRFKDAELRVLDTQKIQNTCILHSCEVIAGEIDHTAKGTSAELSVDAERRMRIRANHSATHLYHAALREVLGSHVKQAGSRVDDSTLRFDYSHFEPVTAEQLLQIEALVNEQIRQNHEVRTRLMGLEDAKKSGAMALFGEKYGAEVRVVEIGPKSLELCGGTHVLRSGEIGFSMVAAEGGISAGVRRIECWSGSGAEAALNSVRHELQQIAALLKSDTAGLSGKIEKILQREKSLQRELEALKSRAASAASGDLLSSVRTSPQGIKVIAEKVDGADSETLKSMVDGLRQKIGSGVVALGSTMGESAVIVAGVTPDLVKKVHAGMLVKEASKDSGGRGGGRPDFAQAGGVDPSRLHDALTRLFELVS